jgi:hypothetical protein
MTGSSVSSEGSHPVEVSAGLGKKIIRVSRNDLLELAGRNGEVASGPCLCGVGQLGNRGSRNIGRLLLIQC